MALGLGETYRSSVIPNNLGGTFELVSLIVFDWKGSRLSGYPKVDLPLQAGAKLEFIYSLVNQA